ncbi:MAG: 4Fe-4S binding protein [Candidatus Altiarchaeota archaeon]
MLNIFFKMRVEPNRCLYCGGCVGVCPHDALILAETRLILDQKKCTECGLCYQFCPVGAIKNE